MSPSTAKRYRSRQRIRCRRNGKIDAFFVVAGYPTGSLVELASAASIKLVPIDGAGADALTSKYGFFASSDIPEDAYEGVKTTTTVAVGAQWFTSANEDEELIYNITKAHWNDESRITSIKSTVHSYSKPTGGVISCYFARARGEIG